jgi:hypothetical protein
MAIKPDIALNTGANFALAIKNRKTKSSVIGIRHIKATGLKKTSERIMSITTP